MHAVGFAEQVVSHYEPSFFTGSRDWDTVIIAELTHVALFLYAVNGLTWVCTPGDTGYEAHVSMSVLTLLWVMFQVNRMNFIFFLSIVLAAFLFLVGSVFRPRNFFEGYTSYNPDTFSENW